MHPSIVVSITIVIVIAIAIVNVLIIVIGWCWGRLSSPSLTWCLKHSGVAPRVLQSRVSPEVVQRHRKVVCQKVVAAVLNYLTAEVASLTGNQVLCRALQ